MPYQSERQRRYIFAEASRGTPWARKFITDSGDTPPAVRKQALTRVRKRKHHRRKHGNAH